MIRNAAGNNTIQGAIGMVAGNGNTLIMSDGGVLNLAGNITGAWQDGPRTLILGGMSTGHNTVSGIVSNNAVNIKETSVTKRDAGTWVLSGANTYTGQTLINAGTLAFTTANSLYTGNTALWTKTNITVSSGATLSLSAGGSGQFNGAQLTTLFSNLTDTIVNNGLLAGSTVVLDVADGTAVTTSLSDSSGTGGGTVGLIKSGAGTLNLDHSPLSGTYTGPTTVQAGVLAVSGTSIADTGTLVIDGGTLDLTNTETVSKLFFGAVEQPPGDYSASSVPAGATITTASFSGSGTLSVSQTAAASLYHEPFDAGSISPSSNAALTFGNSATTSPWTATNILPSQTLGSWAGTNTAIGIGSGSLNIGSVTSVARWRGVMTLIDLNGIDVGTYTAAVAILNNAWPSGNPKNQMNIYRFSGIDSDGGLTFDGLHTGTGADYSPEQNNAIATVGTGASFTNLSQLAIQGANTTLTTTFTLASAGAPGDYLGIVFSSQNLTGQDTAYGVDSVSISVANPYTTWALVNAPGQNPDQDFDGDGVSNAVEFVLGGDKDTNDLAKLPTVDAAGGNLTFSFERDQASIDDGVSVAIEVSTDLADWSTSFAVPAVETAGPPVAVAKDSPAGFDTVTLTVTQAPDTKKFARLHVTVTP